MAEPVTKIAHTEEDEALGDPKGFIKVSSQSNPKAVAGKIAHMTRDESASAPCVLCIGAASINQAVKSICIARQYLERDGIDLSFQPAFRDKDRRASVALYIAKIPTRAPITIAPGTESVELPVSGHSRPPVVAGALAARVREGKQAALVSIGVDAVANAVLTIGNARLYLEENNMDVRCQPTFVTVHKEDRDLNAVRFDVRVDNI